MSVIRNSSHYPLKLVSYQINKTRFGDNGEIIYPGECRYVNADNFHWDTAIILMFTQGANPPGGVEVTGASGSLSLEKLGGLGIKVSVTISHSEAMAGMIMGKHDFVEFYQDYNNTASFKLSNGEGGCRVKHGW